MPSQIEKLATTAPMPAQPELTKTVAPTTQPTAQTPTPLVVDTSTHPSGIGNLTNSQADYLRQQTGWDDNKLNSVYGKEYDPEKGGSFLTNLYQSVKKKPTELTPEREDAARATAGIGQSLQLLGDMYAAGKGAHVAPRDLTNGAVANTDKNIKDIQKLYDAQQEQYDNGLLNSKLQDYQTGKQEFSQNRAAVTAHLRELRAMEAESKKQAIELQKWQAEYGLKKGTELFNENMKQKEFDQKGNQFNHDMTLKKQAQNETARNNAAQNKIGWKNAETADYSAHNKVGNNYAWSYGMGGKDGRTPVASITVNAAPNDPNAYALPTGEKVARLQIDPKDIAHYVNNGKQALANDPQFQAQYQAAIKKQQENGEVSPLAQALLGDKKGTREGDDTIGAFWAQYQYDHQHQPAQQQQQPGYMNYLPGGNESAVGSKKSTSTTPGRVR